RRLAPLRACDDYGTGGDRGKTGRIRRVDGRRAPDDYPLCRRRRPGVLRADGPLRALAGAHRARGDDPLAGRWVEPLPHALSRLRWLSPPARLRRRWTAPWSPPP